MNRLLEVSCTVLLISLLTSTMSVLATVSATDIPKPSIPQFTVSLVDTSYDVPQTASVNPYTGQTTTIDGQHVDARAIEIRIKNEPFTQFEVQNGTSTWTVGYYYQIRWKGHFENDWHEMFIVSDYLLGRDDGSETVCTREGTYSAVEGLSIQQTGMYATFPPDSVLDFQVKAMVGYIHRVVEGGMAPWYFTGEESEWSNTETLKITNSAQTAEPTDSASLNQIGTQTTGQTSVDWLQVTIAVIAAATAAVLLSVVFLVHKKKTNQ